VNDLDGDAERHAAWVAAHLLDPASATAASRVELLTWLTECGLTIDEMVEADGRGQLNSLAGDRALRPGPRLTPPELAERVGIDVSMVHDVRRAAGFPAIDDVTAGLTYEDVPMFELFEAAADFFTRDEVLRLATVMGAAMRRIADACGETFLRDVEAPMKERAPTNELAMARANLAGVELARAATAVFAPMFLGHLEVSTQRTRDARQDSAGYETVPLAVGFVDLSGFTERAGSLAPRDLRDLIVDFEMRASGIVGDHDGRVVKLIGDEVMFSAISADAACAIADALIHAAPAGTHARGGVAYGEVIASGGDLYGSVVNLASRIADIAVPDELLVNDAVVTGAPARRFEPAGRRSLKGFDAPVRLWSLRTE
jgi:adenylate cyclase